MTDIFNIIFRVSINYFFIFSLSVLLILLKHVKLMVKCKLLFENIMSNKTYFCQKKAVARFNKKILPWRKKSTDDPREGSIAAALRKSLSLRTKRRPCCCKKIMSMENLKTTLSVRILRSFRTLNDFCAAKKFFLAFW